MLFKKILFTILLSCAMLSCDSTETERMKFTKTYADILYARERNHDTAKANPEVREILKRNGFTEESFRQKFMQYAKNSGEMRAIFDSANAIFQRRLEKKQ
ncbi:MAG TPA: hypothetical protein VEC36_00725 [Patescibacteria group bacterium]|nr:hypothetical protein [Patescibacteria group bacterium]